LISRYSEFLFFKVRSFGVGVKHIGQTMQTVLKHLVGIEGVKVPSESSNRRMILEIVALAIIGKIITPGNWLFISRETVK
jgi:hypothetical protein